MGKDWKDVNSANDTPKAEEMYLDTTEYKLIYIYWIDDAAHKGLLKIGDASINTPKSYDELLANCTDLNKAARKRIGDQTGTAGIMYHLCHTEIAVRQKGKYLEAFRDNDIHAVLKKSGISQVKINTPGAKPTEWFKVDLDTARNAITAYKQGRKTLLSTEIVSEDDREIILREEQEDAIAKTIACFKSGNQMLWNAKMRYGKTATSLTFVKRELSKYPKTIIITHRPVVESGWKEDFQIVFKKQVCQFLTKDTDSDDSSESSVLDSANEKQLRKAVHEGKPFIYFASIQDLRGSKKAGGKLDKNNFVFDCDWDLIINDEAHEGTQTDLGLKVAELLKKPHTKLLSLSGTPFNIINQFDDDSVYTWDYPMEQARKREWDSLHPGKPNPYADLPMMHIYTYDLGNLIRGYSSELEDKAFNFTEFFRTWTGDSFKDEKKISNEEIIGDFIHKQDVRHFLDLITTESSDSAYPFSTQNYRNMFRHTLWMVPGVKEALALEKMLREHSIFKNFRIANVAGEGDFFEEVHYDDALDKVKKVIKDNDYTITLSCGKLTTGVTVREWTACFMLSGSYATGAANYLQTIFRIQSPGQIDGKTKEHVYVFDFAPDRTLMVLAEAAKVSRKGGSGGTSNDGKNRDAMRNFLNFCPVIAISGTQMKPYSVDSMMEQLKKVYADRAIRTGFDDTSIYNERLLTLDSLDVKEFEELKGIIGSTKAQKIDREVLVNDQGFTEEEYEKAKNLKKKPKKKLSEEEKTELEKLKKQKEERGKAVSILRGISIRMPLLIYGADVPFEEDITIDRFVDLIDEESWKEFMPNGVTKEIFRKFSKYYDRDVFIAAGKEIRRQTKKADMLLPTQRVQNITKLFSYFKNPDKETVLTPWRVVNMHMSASLGGYDFWNENHSETIEEPRFVDQGEVTKKTFANPGAKVLEINSKTGLYPLYVSYSIYRAKCKEWKGELTEEIHQKLWLETLKDNIFVICKTEMAKCITRRTLTGYSNERINAHYFQDLINQFKNKADQVVRKIKLKSYWDKNGDGQMKFDAVVGNPPYQIEGESTRKTPIYNLFYDRSFELSEIVSLISPARFLFDAGQTPTEWNNKMLQDNHFKVIRYFSDSKDVFSSVDIKGGVVITLRDASISFGCIGLFTSNEKLDSIVTKISFFSTDRLNTMISSQGLYRFSQEFFFEHPEAKNLIGEGTGNKIVSSLIEKLPAVFTATSNSENSLRILGRINGKREYRYIERKFIVENEFIDSYKLFIPEANNSGKFGETLTLPIIGYPQDISSDTFLNGGQFSDKTEPRNFSKYFKTKFFRTLLGVKKSTQHCPPGVWQTIPIQDFTCNSDINWSKMIEEIDEQLYLKYRLTQDEINFIEENVLPME